MRINYQIDGNTNTEKDRAGLRLLPMSEVMIQEVKVVTTGFAPEFGQTMGMVLQRRDAVGHQRVPGRGRVTCSVARTFSAFPFFFGCGSTTTAANCPAIADNAVKPETRSTPAPRPSADRSCGTSCSSTADGSRRAAICRRQPDHRDAADRRALGLKPQPAAAPNVQTAKFAIGKGDYQIE